MMLNARHHQLALILAVVLAEAAHLSWEHVHGGIRAHHLLNNADWPAVSNAWGLLLLPLLTWFAVADSQRRGLPWRVAFAGAAGAAVAGLTVVALFLTHQHDMAGYLLLAIVVVGCVVPLYRPQYLLGFVLAMTWTFGAVLPTLVALCVAAISAVASAFVRLLRTHR
ncbi:MAG: hypothetical protein JNL19_01860 [Burkholderiales bacterium]|nr:hypothetical protein [Burkholderiales bacterium]